jgi:5-methylcytosine-specific restriction endonuclease McrA
MAGTWVAPPGWRKLRKVVFARYGHVCHRCGAYADTIDHLRPVILGGDHDPANLRPACRRCNFGTGAALGNRLRGGRVVVRRAWPASRDW